MDSFEQQMLVEIERCYKELNCSIRLSDTFNKQNGYFCEQSETTESNKTNHTSTQSNGNKSNNYVIDKDEHKQHDDENEAEFKFKPEMIYANSNVIRCNGSDSVSSNQNCAVPSGRKPALPPKPKPPKFELNKSKGFVQTARAAIFDRKSPNNKDPAELSLKERLALFEKNKGIILLPKTVSLTKAMPLKPATTVERNCSEQADEPLIQNTPTKDVKIDEQYTEHTAKVNGILSNAKESNGLKNDDITNEDGLEPNLRKKPVPKATSQLNDVTDGFKRSSSPKSPPPLPPTKKSTITSKSRNSIDSPNVRKSIESQTESFKNNNRQIDELLTDTRLQNIRIGSSLYGDLTPIVTTVAPTKMKPDETIGLNDLHQTEPNCSLLNEYNMYPPKEEDKWDKFIECLLFFCCVA